MRHSGTSHIVPICFQNWSLVFVSLFLEAPFRPTHFTTGLSPGILFGGPRGLDFADRKLNCQLHRWPVPDWLVGCLVLDQDASTTMAVTTRIVTVLVGNLQKNTFFCHCYWLGGEIQVSPILMKTQATVNSVGILLIDYERPRFLGINRIEVFTSQVEKIRFNGVVGTPGFSEVICRGNCRKECCNLVEECPLVVEWNTSCF